MIVKKITTALLGASFLVGAASAGQAADIYGRGGSLKDAPYVPAIGWSGFYFGGNLGVTLSDEVQLEEEFDGVEFTNGINLDEALSAGVHIGYNWQTPSNWVYGVEADLGIVNDEFEVVDDENPDLTDYLATVRGRLGIAYGNSLLYTTAGVAFLGYDDEFSDGAGVDDTAIGFVVGAGVEHKFSSNWSVGLEGLYYDVSSDFDDGEDELDREFWNLRARLSYHFNRSYSEPLK